MSSSEASKARMSRGQGEEQNWTNCSSENVLDTLRGQKQRWPKYWANHVGPDPRPAQACEELNLEALGLPHPLPMPLTYALCHVPCNPSS